MEVQVLQLQLRLQLQLQLQLLHNNTLVVNVFNKMHFLQKKKYSHFLENRPNQNFVTENL